MALFTSLLTLHTHYTSFHLQLTSLLTLIPHTNPFGSKRTRFTRLKLVLISVSGTSVSQCPLNFRKGSTQPQHIEGRQKDMSYCICLNVVVVYSLQAEMSSFVVAVASLERISLVLVVYCAHSSGK